MLFYPLDYALFKDKIPSDPVKPILKIVSKNVMFLVLTRRGAKDKHDLVLGEANGIPFR